MNATLDFINDRFRRFNALCFGGVLPAIPLRISNARACFGTFRHPIRRDPRHPLGGECSITISGRLDLEENDIEDILIHEMIHFYIWHTRLRDSSAHGSVFRQIMNDINARHGRAISISRRTSAAERDTDSHLKHHYICLTRWKDGRTLITLCARPRIFEINDAFRRAPMIEAVEWYWSTDPFFNRFPVSRTPKAYGISPGELSQHLASAVRCECSATRFSPCRATR